MVNFFSDTVLIKYKVIGVRCIMACPCESRGINTCLKAISGVMLEVSTFRLTLSYLKIKINILGNS
jgi:hypothetical protein